MFSKDPVNSFSDSIYEFGPFRLDTARRTLFRDGEPVGLAPKALDMLVVLVTHRGEVLEKDKLMDLLWPDSIVEEANLPLNVSALRKALGESPGERKYIVTIPGTGYKFAAEVHAVELREKDSLVIGTAYSRDKVAIEEATHGGEAPFQGRLVTRVSARLWSRASLLTLGIIVGMAAVGWYAWRTKSQPDPVIVRSLAVMPFVTLGDTDEQLGMGLADVLITRLSGLRTIMIRPTSSVLRYAGGRRGASEIGRELGVESVLEGTVQRSDGRIRITARLLRAADGMPLWAGQFDALSSDIFSVEDAISEQLAERLASHLNTEQRLALARHDTQTPQAHALFLKGRYQVEKRTPEGSRKAIEFFTEALSLDPNSALSYTGLAEAYLSATMTGGMVPNEAFPLMKRAAMRALELDPLLADAYCMRGVTKFWHEWDYAGAERDFKRAIEINPNLALAHEYYGHLLSNLAEPDEALRESARALEIDPTSLVFNTLRGQKLMYARRYDDAIAHLRKSLEFEPNFWMTHLTLAKVYECKGMYENAISEYQEARRLSPSSSESTSYLGHTYAVMKRRNEANEAIKELKQMSLKGYVAPKGIALIYAGLGEQDSMYDWLEKAYEGRDVGLAFIKVEPRWDPYRSDPRFADLMRRVGFQVSTSDSPKTNSHGR
jgi:DNA-binding winged helix-turn-helix (wHTH) protein/TolB-like protein/Tfp pilus assembly protein PilF